MISTSKGYVEGKQIIKVRKVHVYVRCSKGWQSMYMYLCKFYFEIFQKPLSISVPGYIKGEKANAIRYNELQTRLKGKLTAH